LGILASIAEVDKKVAGERREYTTNGAIAAPMTGVRAFAYPQAPLKSRRFSPAYSYCVLRLALGDNYPQKLCIKLWDRRVWTDQTLCWRTLALLAQK
jgi:hypothetical protein